MLGLACSGAVFTPIAGAFGLQSTTHVGTNSTISCKNGDDVNEDNDDEDEGKLSCHTASFLSLSLVFRV